LSDLTVILRGLDYLTGLVLVALFSSFVFFVGQMMVFPRFFGGISFLVWISTGGLSSSMKKFLVQRGEGRWLEVTGGQGFFSLFSSLGGYFSYLSRLSLKGIGMILISKAIVF